MKLVSLVFCGLMLAACRPVMPEAVPVAVPQPTEDAGEALAEQLVGIWTGPAPMQFNADGTFAVAEMSQLLASRPIDQGQYTLDETTLTLVSNDQSYICEDQVVGTYTVEMDENGAAWLHLLTDACGDRATVFPGQYHRK